MAVLEPAEDTASNDASAAAGRARFRGIRRKSGAAAAGLLLALIPPLAVSSAPSENDTGGSDRVDPRTVPALLRIQEKELEAQGRMLRQQQATIDRLLAARGLETETAAPAPRSLPKRRLRRRAVAAAKPAAKPAAAPAAMTLHQAALAAISPPQEQPVQIGAAGGSAVPQAPPAEQSQPAPTTQPVGQAPAQPEHAPEVAAIADLGGVLTKRGTLVVEPFVQYVRSSLNNFSIQGVQILNNILIGLINAGRSQNDLSESGVTLRYGIANRLEAEVKVPYVYRANHFVATPVGSSGSQSVQNADGAGLGDVEGAVHYQINNGRDDWPYFIANLRFKSDSGTGPFDVRYHSDGTPARLPTGSGFPAVEPSLTVIYPSDPAILFANVGWIRNFGGNIGRNIAGSAIGDVTPGDTYSLSTGIGVALNERLSFVLGYEHNYIQATKETLNGQRQSSGALQVGQAILGLSFKANEHTAFNLELDAGVTRDAPDAELTLRVPLSVDLCDGPAFLCR